MSTLTYGLVERCNDIASCRQLLFKISISCVFTSATIFVLMNYDEHDEQFDECIFFHCRLHYIMHM